MRSSRIEIASATVLSCIFLLVFSTQILSGIDHVSRGLVTERTMVVSAHPLASEIGVEIMKRGGNAVDAAVAVQFALAVVYPNAGNIGGGGFMVYRGNDGTALSLDFRETAPALAHRDMYLDEDGNARSEWSRLGHRAAGVPGSVAGMFAAHERLGKLPMKVLVQPSIDLAEEGHVLTAAVATGLNRFSEVIDRHSTQPSVYGSKSDWKEGDWIKHPELADTLRLIRDHGAAGFYEGDTANKIVSEMERGGGLISHDDLRNYRAKWRDPIISEYKEYRLITMGPPSSGGIALSQLLTIVENFPDRIAKGFQSVEAVHLMVEAERRVYADRAEHLGDSDFYPVPIKGLLDVDYLLKRMSNFDAEKASISENISAGEPAGIESEETTHFSVVDAEGNAVSITTTINGSYGNKVAVGGGGFLLNNEMDDFSAKPGVPNMFGLIGAEANAIEPGKRMLSSMTPTILEKEGALFMVVGTPGGSTIITSVFQVILNVLEFNMTMQAAVSAARFHHQWKPDAIQASRDALTAETRAKLKEMGHEMRERPPIGRVDAILILPDGRLEGGADPRGDDAASGF